MPYDFRVNRRQIIRNAGMAGLGLATMASLPRSAFGAEPAKGGILTIGSYGDPPNFDIFSNSTALVLDVVGPCYNSLLMFDPMDPEKVVGDLAESWEVSPDGKTYTFKIITTAKFHDGKPLTSADVKYTFDTVRKPPEGTASSRKNLLAAIESIETPDDHTIKINLSRQNPSLLTILATAWFVIAPKHILEVKGNTKEDIIGSGPFMLKEYKRGTSIELVRNPNYHVADRPYLDGTTIYNIPDMGTKAAYLKTGQIMMIIDMPPNDALAVGRDAGDIINVLSASNNNGDPFVMNSLRKPFDDVRVRKAIAYSTDHADALKVIYGGAGTVAGFLAPGKWAMPADLLAQQPGYGPDLEANRAEARKLLAEAGYGSGFKTTITGRKSSGSHEQRVVYLADQLKKIGIDAEIKILETAAYLDTLKERNFDIATNIINSPANDPDLLVADFHTCNGSLNYSGVCNAKVDELYQKQSQTVDDAERLKIVTQMEVEAMNGFGMVVFYFKKKYVATSKQVNGYVMHGEPDNNRRFQGVWLS